MTDLQKVINNFTSNKKLKFTISEIEGFANICINLGKRMRDLELQEKELINSYNEFKNKPAHE